MPVIRAIRKFKPEIILANAVYDRHIDHGKGASLGYDASFLAGLAKIETTDDEGKKQAPWRPRAVYHYIQSNFIEPDFIVDISDFQETKMKAIIAFKTQFFDPESTEPETYISSPNFLRMLEAERPNLGMRSVCATEKDLPFVVIPELIVCSIFFRAQGDGPSMIHLL